MHFSTRPMIDTILLQFYYYKIDSAVRVNLGFHNLAAIFVVSVCVF